VVRRRRIDPDQPDPRAGAFAGYLASALVGPFLAWRILEWGVPGALLVAGLALGLRAGLNWKFNWGAAPVTARY